MGNSSSSSNCIECDCDELTKKARNIALSKNGIATKVRKYINDTIEERIPDDNDGSQKDDSLKDYIASGTNIFTKYVDTGNMLNESFVGGISLKEGLDDSLNCNAINDKDCPDLDCSDQINALRQDINDELEDGMFLSNAIYNRINSAFMSSGQPPPYTDPNLSSNQTKEYQDITNWISAKEFLSGNLNENTISSFIVKESMQNYQDLNSGFIDSAFAARYNYFKDKSNFSEQCESNASTSIDEFITNIKQELDFNNSSYITLLNNYKSLYKLKTSISTLTSDKNRQIANIEKDINYYKKGLTLDNTKASYKNDDLNFNKSVKYFLLILYYFAFVVYLIFSNFIKDKLYENKKIVFLLFLFLISPFIIGYILNGIVSLYIYIIEYFNIKGEILSYNDIVNNSNIA